MNGLMESQLWQVAGWTMLHFMWIGTLIGLLALAGRWLLKSANPNVRYAFAVLSLALLASAPVGIVSYVAKQTSQVDVSHRLPDTALPYAVTALPDEMLITGNVPATNTQNATANHSLASANNERTPVVTPWYSSAMVDKIAAYFPWCWLIGAPLTFIFIATGLMGAERLKHQSRLLDRGPVLATCRRLADSMNITRQVVIGVCDRIASPILVGLVRPIILLPPAALTGWSMEQLEMVLLHELAHMRRWDNVVNLIQRVIESILFFHPAVWLISRWVRSEREHCCDQLAINYTGRPRAYAEMLVHIASPGLLPGHAAVAMGENNLVSRIRNILNLEEHTMKLSRKVMSFVTIAVVGGFLVVGASTQQVKSNPVSQTKPTQEKGISQVRGIVQDENGKPVKGAEVKFLDGKLSDDGVVKTTEDGRFYLPINHRTLQYQTILAVADGGVRQGIYKFGDDARYDISSPPIIVLKPSRKVTIEVFDDSGKPVADASVAVMHTYAFAASGTTDIDGKVTFKLAEDFKIWWAVGLKAGVGFDYYENYPSWPPPWERKTNPLPDRVELVLDGARQARIRAIDSDDKPIAGTSFTPWTIKKPGKLSRVNLGGSLFGDQSFFGTTNTKGIAIFDWFPLHFERGTAFLNRSNDIYHLPKPPRLGPQGTENELTARLLRNVKVTGKVYLPNGKPAGGILIQAEGRGGSNHYCRRQTLSASDGSYEFNLYPNQAYIFAVINDQWAANHTSEKIKEGDSQGDLNFHLSKGTLIHGTAKWGDDDGPAVGKTITLIQMANPYGQRLVSWATTDENGRYEFRVAPGRYELRGPRQKEKEDLTITDQKEIVRDLSVDRSAEKSTLSGLVIDRMTQKPIRKAIVHAGYIDGGRADIQARVDRKGQFTLERYHEQMVVYARDPQGTRAGYAEVSGDDKQVRIEVIPAAAVTGRVVDEHDKPLPNERVWGEIRLPKTTIHQDFSTLTDDNGVFVLAGYPVGSEGSILVQNHKKTSRSSVYRFSVRNHDLIHIPEDIVIGPDGPRKITTTQPAGPIG